MSANACNTLANLQAAVTGTAYGIVQTVTTNGVKRNYIPEADTNAARVAALTEALANVPQGGQVVLLAGSYILSQKLEVLAAHKNWKLDFHPGSWLAYTDERLAVESHMFYQGTQRYAWQHGIIPTPPGEGMLVAPDVMRSRIMAALFSMRPTYDPVEQVPEYTSAEITLRCGNLHLYQGGHFINKPIYMTGFQQLIGIDGRLTQIHPYTGFAPKGGPEIFCIQFLRSLVNLGAGLQPASNFSFDFRIENISLQNFWPDDTNYMTSGLLFGGAQGSRVDGLAVAGMGQRGIVVHGNSNYFHLGRLFLDGGHEPDGTPYQKGPHLEINFCANFELGEMELQLLNNNPTLPPKQYAVNGQLVDLMGLAMHACGDFNIEKINGEQMRCLARLVDCENFTIGPVANGLNNFYRPPGGGADIPVGGTMFSMRGSRFYTIGGFNGVGYERLYRLTKSTDGTYLDEAYVGTGGGLARHGQINHDLKIPDYVTVHGINMPKNYESLPVGTVDNSTWQIGTGGPPDQFVFFITSFNAAGAAYGHVALARPGEAGGQWPGGFTISLDTGAAGGVTVGKIFNVGWQGGAPVANPEIRVNNVKVLGPQQGAIANSADPTTNAILAALRAHGIIAT